MNWNSRSHRHHRWAGVAAVSFVLFGPPYLPYATASDLGLSTTTCPPAELLTGLSWATNKVDFVWSPQLSGSTYVVMKGSLTGIHANGGNFADSMVVGALECGLTTAASVEEDIPSPGSGWLYVVQATNSCGSVGTFNDGVSQVGDRDGEIAANPYACATADTCGTRVLANGVYTKTVCASSQVEAGILAGVQVCDPTCDLGTCDGLGECLATDMPGFVGTTDYANHGQVSCPAGQNLWSVIFTVRKQGRCNCACFA